MTESTKCLGKRSAGEARRPELLSDEKINPLGIFREDDGEGQSSPMIMNSGV